jgi:hypothetical protein
VANSHPRASTPPPSSPASSPATATATADPYPSVKDITCRQLSDAYLGDYDIGVPPNDWGGLLLAALVGADGIDATLSGLASWVLLSTWHKPASIPRYSSNLSEL